MYMYPAAEIGSLGTVCLSLSGPREGQWGSPVDSVPACHPDDQGSNPRVEILEAVFGVPRDCKISMDVKQHFTHSQRRNM